MAELANCAKCGRLFVKHSIRDVCESCYREEERQFERVYAFLRRRENRTATMAQVVDATGVEEKLIIKWIRAGRLQLVHFPNLGYPCDSCGAMIREGRLCAKCLGQLQADLRRAEEEKERGASSPRQTTYYTQDKTKR
ncbi:TIGR03826 family flagellar region protein [Geobacillus sp. BK01]|uniref:TIGR03826 family flagellar region protein n=1 Tax=Geobacillus sp. BK01 TaxID=3457328 RepID=UPI003FA5847A